MNDLEPMNKQQIAEFLKTSISTVNYCIWKKKVKGIYKINKYEYLINKKELLQNFVLGIKSKNDK